MKAHIDQEKCTICASCVAICPEVFELKDDASVGVKDEFEGKEIPKELEDKVREASTMCPAGAIVVEE
jgi:ferredoxin